MRVWFDFEKRGLDGQGNGFSDVESAFAGGMKVDCVEHVNLSECGDFV